MTQSVRSRLLLVCLMLTLSDGCGSSLAGKPAASAARTGAAHPSGPCGTAATGCSRADVRLADLLYELVDLDQLARLPEHTYTGALASSFDPASRQTRLDEPEWFANRDFARFPEDGVLTLLDATGPGALTRIWSANPSGVLRVFIDGAREPALEAPMRELLTGSAGIDGELAFEAAAGANLYLPIPYQRRCVVTVTSSARRLYYQVNYRSYARGVSVESWSRAALQASAGALREVSAALQQRLPRPAPSQRTVTRRGELRSDLNNAQTLTAADGGSVLRLLRAKLQAPSAAALRETMLQIDADGERTVEAPFGDFFGSGPGLSHVDALPVQVDADSATFASRWPMPFARELRVRVVRTGQSVLRGELELISEAQRFDERSLLFHAHFLAPTLHDSKPTHAFTLVQLQGQGVYVGTVLNVDNGDASWWGEGDEQIWVDADAFPSHFGTGTEDYFGYAFCSNERFSRPFIGQTRSGTRANFGRSSLYRFHVLDAIRFERALRFDLEVNHWGKASVPMVYDAVSYFYARPGLRVAPPPAAATQYRIPELAVPEPADVAEAPYRCGS